MATPYAKMTPEQKARAHAANRRYWAKNKEKLAEKKRKHYHAHRDHYLQKERVRSYQKLYGITVEDYDRMLNSQGGCCAICKSPSPNSGKQDKYFSVDHCHETGRVRGLLCLSCNVSLGKFEKYRSEIFAYLGW